jgi:hypothetical protein
MAAALEGFLADDQALGNFSFQFNLPRFGSAYYLLIGCRI